MRAIMTEGIKVENWPDRPDGSIMDVYVWFIGRLDEDEWFAHGVSDYMDSGCADEVFASVEGDRMDVLLTYGGHTWQEICECGVVALSSLHRSMVAAMSADKWTELLQMGKTELLELRLREENQHAPDQSQWN
jgi:hypothetical protein